MLEISNYPLSSWFPSVLRVWLPHVPFFPVCDCYVKPLEEFILEPLNLKVNAISIRSRSPLVESNHDLESHGWMLWYLISIPAIIFLYTSFVSCDLLILYFMFISI